MAETGPRRGLVLGGGGVLGAAWTVGALNALQDVHGFRPEDCDIVVGTSAGSVIGALLAAGVSSDQLLAHQRGEPIVSGPLAGYSWDYETATGGSRPTMPKLRGPGSFKLIANSLRDLTKRPPTAVLSAFMPIGTGSLERVGHLIDAITPMDAWSPHPNFWVVAMDYINGQRVVFGQAHAPEAALSDAVMASCAIPSWFEPVVIDQRPYVDGGAWSATSVDVLLGAELDEVYVIAPMMSFADDEPEGLVTRLERQWRHRVTRRCMQEVNDVEAQGARVHVIGPGLADLEAMGSNIMDVGRRLNVLETSLTTSRQAWGGGGAGNFAQTG
ncbi:MAG: patatin-like phospholipase family protein [Candidatus Nanopelagicales bacterium]